MTITLTPELEKAVAERAKSGGNAAECQFVCEVLRETLSYQKKQNAWLQAEAQIGIDDIEAGRVIAVGIKGR